MFVKISITHLSEKCKHLFLFFEKNFFIETGMLSEPYSVSVLFVLKSFHIKLKYKNLLPYP